jgi:hypothetical protein
MRTLIAAAVFLVACRSATAAEPSGTAPSVTGIQVAHRHGQTFITWRDAAEGEAGAKFRYSLYRAEKPITADNLADAELCYRGVLHNSAKLYGSAFRPADRLNPELPYAVIEEGAKPLPPWSGLAVVTADKPRKSYYAVVATDEAYAPLGKVVAGESATTTAVEERPAPIRAIKLYDSKERTGPYVSSTSITGKTGLPLHVTLHGSQGAGGGAGEYGDYYLYFGTPEMGYRDGLAGVFSVSEQRDKAGNRLLLRLRDAVERPDGRGAMETYWFGYTCVPQGATHAETRFYPYTENQILWITRWVVERYQCDPNRVTVGGSSSGGVGSNNVGFRHPELFAAVYPSVGRVRRVPAIALAGKFDREAGALMFDGKTQYYDRADGVRFAAEHSADLPFLGWACGRRDYAATWDQHIDMVRAMTEARHGFAFSWNNGDHSGGGRAMSEITKYYPAEKFAKNQSYPAFTHSSIDDDMGPGDPAVGDLEGGINLGFDWKDVRDEAAAWSIAVSNSLAKEPMTVDVTPRRCQKFKPRPSETIRWTSSTGDSGTAVVDAAGLVTVPQLRIRPDEATVLTLSSEK